MAKVENVFKVAKQSLVITPRTLPFQAFLYMGVQDLENLVRFLGVGPRVLFEKGKMTYQFGKVVVPDGSVITRNIYGEVVLCLSLKDANEKYDIKAERDFDNAKDAQTVAPKPKKTRTKK